jgi:cytochrome oxidase Cu insertion factor (SCO1/SenC/PrrC family)
MSCREPDRATEDEHTIMLRIEKTFVRLICILVGMMAVHCRTPRFEVLEPPVSLEGISLVDVDHRVVDTKDILFVVTGYTRCPDICPTTLRSAVMVMDRLPAASRARFAFLSVDAKNDSPQKTRDYASGFSKKLIALDPSIESSRRFLTLASVFASVDSETALIQHSTSILWVQDGKIMRKIPIRFASQDLVEEIQEAEREKAERRNI